MLVSAALISLVQVGTVEAWMVVIVIGREFAVTGLRSVSAAQGLVIEASDLGKYKTFAQYLAVTLLILERSVPAGFDSEFVYVSRGMLWAALTLTVFSGIDYFVRFYRASDVERPGPGRRALALSALWLLGAYVVGAIPVGYVVARILGVDIRRRGSGNIGATNVLRTAGWTPAIATLVGDVAKGYAATWIGSRAGAGPGGPARRRSSRWSATAGPSSSGSGAGRAWRPLSARSSASRPGR